MTSECVFVCVCVRNAGRALCKWMGRRTDVSAHLYRVRRPSEGGHGGGNTWRGARLERPYPNILSAPRRCHMAAGGEDPYGAQCQPQCFQPMCSPLDPQTVSKQIGGGGSRK